MATELYQLITWARVVETGSVTGAANQLGLSQPAVTKQVRQLEAAVGVPLLERRGRGVRPTVAGEVLAAYARRIAGLVGEATAAAATAGRSGGRLVLAAATTVSIVKLPGLLSAYRQDHPQVEVVVYSGDSSHVCDLVSDDLADCGIVTTALRRPALVTLPLFWDDMLLVVPGGHPWALRRQVRPAAVAQQPLVLFRRGSGFRAYLDQILEDAGVVPRVAMELDSMEAIKQMVEAGLGAAFLPRSAVTPELVAGTLVDVSLTGIPPMRRQTSLVYRQDKMVSPALAAWFALLADRFGQSVPTASRWP